jgi:formyltetrahydrofolate-dependent phosphoribosylglycinamide formyltransferase
MNRIKVGVLISGRGSNLAALAAAARAEDYPATIVLVLSNNPDAGGLAFARGEGIAARAIDAKPYGKDRQAHERALDAALRDAGAEVVALAGYMRIFTPWFIAAWAGRMINIHPSLLPAFPGLHTHERALEAGVAEAGCTVHLVTEAVDGGPILGQARVPVLAGDDPETLAARVLAAEHRLYPGCLAQFCRALGA